MITAAQVMTALEAVRDPELDESVVALDFVADVTVEDPDVSVTLRLPTFFCAANFAWLMVADAKAAVQTIPGVGTVEVSLPDHYASDEITEGVNGRGDFDLTFDDQADGGGLDPLRQTFRRKAFLSRQHRLLRTMIAAGSTQEDLLGLTVADVPDGPERSVYIQRRAELGLDVSDAAPLVVSDEGRTISSDEIADHLVWIRTVSVSIEGNAGACRGLLAARYGLPDPDTGQTRPLPMALGKFAPPQHPPPAQQEAYT